MSDSNSLRLIRMPEASYGVAVPALARLMDVTSESLDFSIDFTQSERIANDRNNQGSIATAARAGGSINNELSFLQNIPEIESAMFNRFNKIGYIENTAVDTEITQVLNSTDTITVLTGGLAFKAGHIVLLSGFTNANNSGIFKVASSTATTIVLANAPVLTDESAPPLGASVRVVGFEGAAGDITATLTGLASTVLNFTTLGLAVHQWIKIGGAPLSSKYSGGALANNDFARITAITANAITLDNLPDGWVADVGAGKTIRIWLGDYVRNGVTKISHTYEKAFTSQAIPEYYTFTGCIVDKLSIEASTGGISKIDATMLGQTQTSTNVTVNASPVPAVVEDGFNAINDVARMIEGGINITTRNPAMDFKLDIANNLREKPAIGYYGSVSLGVGSCDVTGSVTTYFDTKELVEKYKNQEKTSFGNIFKKDGKAMVIFLPTVKITSASVAAGGRNQDVKASLNYRAQKDTNQPYSIQIDIFHYIQE